jgi:hypothetical protein
LGDVIIHVCAGDGQSIGEFEENDFRDNFLAGRFPADSHYWHEGMEDWGPVTSYRALAKTQRISFAAPRPRTVKIDMDAVSKSDIRPASAKAAGGIARFWAKITGRRS